MKGLSKFIPHNPVVNTKLHLSPLWPVWKNPNRNIIFGPEIFRADDSSLGEKREFYANCLHDSFLIHVRNGDEGVMDISTKLAAKINGIPIFFPSNTGNGSSGFRSEIFLENRNTLEIVISKPGKQLFKIWIERLGDCTYP